MHAADRVATVSRRGGLHETAALISQIVASNGGSVACGYYEVEDALGLRRFSQPGDLARDAFWAADPRASFVERAAEAEALLRTGWQFGERPYAKERSKR